MRGFKSHPADVMVADDGSKMLDTLERAQPVVSLSRNDRCDGCSARAYIVASKDGQSLMFCGHHGRRHGEALVGSGWQIYDLTNEEDGPGESEER